MPDDQIQFSIRIPKDLHERLTRMAKAGYRSLNGEIVRILDTSTQAYPARAKKDN